MSEQKSWHQQLLRHNRDEIVQAGQELFFQYNFPDITIKDVCDRAGMSRVTFYKHFRDINELVIEVQMRTLQQMTDMLAITDPSMQNGLERLANMMKKWAHYARTHAEQLRFIALFDLYYQSMIADDELQARYEQFVHAETGRSFLQDALEQGVRDGSMQSQLDVFHTGVLIFQTLMGVLQRVSMTSTPEPYDQNEHVIDRIVQPVIQMLLQHVAAEQLQIKRD